MDLNVQVRREDGAILFARSVTEAMQMANEDQTIWKISWTDAVTDERIRLVRHAGAIGLSPDGDLWVFAYPDGVI